MSSFEDEFLRGQRDCQSGVAHRDGQSEEYDRGYSAQYEMEQMATELAFSNRDIIGVYSWT